MASVARAPPAKPAWPPTFFVNAEEFFSGGGGAGTEAGYAYDSTYVDKATGIVGAEAILRGVSMDPSCEAVNPGNACATLSVAGHRYLTFADGLPGCCRCCSWGNGCSPFQAGWAANATYIGSKTVRGELCYSYAIQNNNTLSVRASDGMLCELDSVDGGNRAYAEFIPSTFKTQIPGGIFSVPAGCDTWCGAHGDCARG